MFKYVLIIGVTIVVFCIYFPKVLSGMKELSDRRWERRQERYEWRQEKQDDREEGRQQRFWHRKQVVAD